MYQVVTRPDAAAYVQGRANGSLGPHDLKVSYRGAEADDLVDAIEDTLETVLEGWHAREDTKYRTDQSRDELEGELSAELHSGLAALPASVLTDRDFWRFCATYLYDFVTWRQPSKTVTASLAYFGAQSNGIGRECVPHRMFDRAHIASVGGFLSGDDDPYSLAKFGAADVWKSHILRVANGNAPMVAREILQDVKEGTLKTDVVRPMVRNLRRARSNIIFEILNQEQARSLVDRETARVINSGPALDHERLSD
ncbi:hypothetical protein [Dietzia kunjamensis]|uniref:hypothetical protein n=1 Tax=Dietzia kunjamensis TaxID=322509 RepID=UPI00209848C4|nr:hypothetical protein [Dietzia kunjamensis]USX46296.1 hypothetical protein NHB83_01970 [Dietzia kunjamensis]